MAADFWTLDAAFFNDLAAYGAMIAGSLDILILEDVPADADAIEAELREESIKFTARRCDNRESFLAALRDRLPAVVLSDFTLPTFDAMQALSLLKEIDDDVPFILVTGARSEEVAVECIRAGADDYILKSSLKRLSASIANAVRKKAAEREKKRSDQALRRLPQLIRDAQETERRRVARDLHDGVIQILSSIRFRSQALQEHLAPKDATAGQDAHQISSLLEKAIQEVRAISHNLLPSELDDLGLRVAVRKLVEEFQRRTAWEVSVVFEAPHEASWPDRVKLNLYRIVQEALTNVEKHADARRVEITLRESAVGFSLVIHDDGVGWTDGHQAASRDATPGLGMGLVDVRARATELGGTAAIETKSGSGFKLTLTIPLPCP